VNAAALQVRHRDWRNSSTLAFSAVEIAPDAAQVQHNAAVAALHDGDPAAAERFAREALRLFPGRGETEAVLALSLAELGRPDVGWLADVLGMPAAAALGETREEALRAAEALVLRTLADRVEHHELPAQKLEISFVAA